MGFGLLIPGHLHAFPGIVPAQKCSCHPAFWQGGWAHLARACAGATHPRNSAQRGDNGPVSPPSASTIWVGRIAPRACAWRRTRTWRLGMMRPQPDRLPNSCERRLVHTRCFGHQPRAPVRRLLGPALKRHGEHVFDLGIGDLARLSRTRRIEQSVQPLIDKASPPLADRLQCHAQTLRHLRIGRPLGTAQHDARSQRQRLRRGAAPHPLDQAVVLFDRESQLRQWPSRTRVRLPMMTLLCDR